MVGAAAGPHSSLLSPDCCGCCVATGVLQSVISAGVLSAKLVGFSDCSVTLVVFPWGIHGVSGVSAQNGWHCLMKRRFRSVQRPDPSSRTICCPLSRTSVIMPVLSQWFGCGPVWFWTETVSPTFKFGRVSHVRYTVLCSTNDVF